MRFEIFPTHLNTGYPEPTITAAQWYWRLRARNGKIMAVGGEGYAKKGNARRAARRFETALSTTIHPIVEVDA